MNKLEIRKATIEDLDLIFGWANDEEGRRNSFNQEKIPYEDHCAWYKKKMESKESVIYILMLDDVPAGQCRLDFEGTKGLISYFVDKEYRGRGYGKKILSLVYEKVKDDFPDAASFVAQVKEGNAASQRVFLSLGYKEKVIGNIREYSLDIRE